MISMVVYYPSKEKAGVIYFSGKEVLQHLQEIRDYEKRCNNKVPAGDGGFLFCSRELKPAEKLNYLVEMWNSYPEIKSSAVLYVVGRLVAGLGFGLVLNLKS